MFFIAYFGEKNQLFLWLEANINYLTFNFRLAKLISQVQWSKTGINFIVDSDYYPWIRKQDPVSPSPKEDDTSLAMKNLYVSLGQVNRFSGCNVETDWMHLVKLLQLRSQVNWTTKYPLFSNLFVL